MLNLQMQRTYLCTHRVLESIQSPGGRNSDNRGSELVELRFCKQTSLINIKAKHARRAIEDSLSQYAWERGLQKSIKLSPVTNWKGKKAQIIFSLGNPFP